MIRRRIALIVAVLVASLLATSARASVSIAVDRAKVATAIGHTFVFRTTIANDGVAPAENLIAHLNVLSLRNGVYVDPEDWSSRRTRYLAPIPAGGALTITWKLQAVNSGSFGVYVAALPQSGAPRRPIVGPTLRVDVAHRETLNSGGILPLALGIPAVLAAAALGLRLKRRRPLSQTG